MGAKRKLWTAVKVATVPLVLALLYLVLRRIGFRSIFLEMKRASGASVWVAALLQLVVFVLWSVRWQSLMRREERCSILALFPIFMAGVFGNIITPGARVGGEPIRAYYMSRAFGGQKTAYLGTILADKFGNGAVFMGFLLISICFVLAFVPLPVAPKLVLGAALLLVAVAVASGLLLRGKIGRNSPLLGKLLPAAYDNRLLAFSRRQFPTYEAFEEYCIAKLDNIISPIRHAAVSPKALTKIVGFSIVSWLLLCLAHYVLFVGLGVQVGFFRVLIIVTISTFFGDISVSPGGAGFMEAAMLGMCAAFGIDHSAAAAVTLISRGIFYLWGLGLGGLSLAALAALYGRTQSSSSEAPNAAR